MAKQEGGPSGPVPKHYEGIVNLITERYEGLSDGFRQIARFLTQNPNAVAIESINAIAAQCAVHPSSLVRFAQTLGYSGFKEMQAVFQTRLATMAPGFRERIGALEDELSRNGRQGNLGFLRQLVVRDMAALEGLLDTVTEEALDQTASLLTASDTIYLAGQLRSEPIAVLLRYMLTMLGRRVVLLDASGGLAPEMARTMTERDVLMAITFRHYAQEVLAVCDAAVENGTPIVAITDSALSPLAKDADVLFTVPEEEYSFSRSIAAPMCLVQCIAVATAARLQPGQGSAPRIPTVTERVRRRDGSETRQSRRTGRRRPA